MEEKSYQGRKQSVEQYNEESFQSFIQSVKDRGEWPDWKFMVEGDLIIDPTKLLDAISTLSNKNVLMIDHKQKILHFMNRETYELNLDS